ncbi:signal peptidase I [Bombilactobacillus thymidiniphilus]|uniref:Signal peptidase I n=1 Tax=Bombilactobacillus thymidiniphilus TaxID=2923363 RepID=A0ABY4PCR0_9LACO|nr:signal peptidase I [Bombilactobacillus thymidiniphilus]UQS83553.1 signal peptidase I [Bombilactobacillus thymidiniphilus]
MSKNNQDDNSLKGWLIWIVQTLILAAVLFGILSLVNHFVLDNARVSGTSMQPTFEDGDRVIGVRNAKLNTGDVVIVDAPDEPGQYYIKRIIATPGQTVKAQNNKIYVNNKKLNQPYLKAGFKLVDNGSNGVYGTRYADTGDFSISSLAKTSYYKDIYSKKQLQNLQKTNAVPKDSYFVMGDHRSVSKDSRYIGFIKRDKVVGVVKLRYWPLNHLQIFN